MSDHQALAEEILSHMSFATGAGARMHVERAALRKMTALIRPSLVQELRRPKDPQDPDDTPPGEPRWNARKRFVLAGFEAIGRLAALKATNRGSVLIERIDLRSAYEEVRQHYAQQPGPYCPRDDD